jgi:2-polyprenyl-3-methyl-5-hydroxy-6-metoxy-1,4-benzoquinol methylase
MRHRCDTSPINASGMFMAPQLRSLPESVVAAGGPVWDLGQLQHRHCPVCDHDSPAPVARRPDGLLVHQCPCCGLLYLGEVPHQPEVDRFYEDYSRFKRYSVPQARLWPSRALAARTNRFISILNETGGIRGLSVCEIGCSHGDFLQLIRHCGGRPVGVERDAAAKNSLERRGIAVAEDIRATGQQDIVCLFDVLEHLVAPRDMVSAIAGALRGDGRVLISVPNGGEYAKIGPSWVGFRVDLEHLNYFDSRNLSALLHEHRLYVEHYWEHSQPDLRRHGQRHAGLAGRLLRAAASVFHGPPAVGNTYAPGSYALTVLARKA